MEIFNRSFCTTDEKNLQSNVQPRPWSPGAKTFWDCSHAMRRLHSAKTKTWTYFTFSQLLYEVHQEETIARIWAEYDLSRFSSSPAVNCKHVPRLLIVLIKVQKLRTNFLWRRRRRYKRRSWEEWDVSLFLVFKTIASPISHTLLLFSALERLHGNANTFAHWDHEHNSSSTSFSLKWHIAYDAWPRPTLRSDTYVAAGVLQMGFIKSVCMAVTLNRLL
jgi:hypothetical protein